MQKTHVSGEYKKNIYNLIIQAINVQVENVLISYYLLLLMILLGQNGLIGDWKCNKLVNVSIWSMEHIHLFEFWNVVASAGFLFLIQALNL